MISRISSHDSARTYCSVSETKLMQIRRNNHIILKHIHSKVLGHIRMETFLEPHEVHRFLQQIKKLNTDQPDTEAFKKKIRKMLLTINDSLLEFGQAVYSGEVALYPIDISQNCDFTQKSSTSVGEVPSLSSIELTNTNFMTLPNNSQNCLELDDYESHLNMRKEDSTNSLICEYLDPKVLSTVNEIGHERQRDIERIEMRPLLDNNFKKPIRRKVSSLVNSETRSSTMQRCKDLSNNENTNDTQLSIQQDYQNSTKTRKRKLNSDDYTSHLDQETFSSELEGLHLDPTKSRAICKNDQNVCKNKLYKILDSNKKTNDSTKSNIDGQLNFQDVCAENKPLICSDPVRKKYCVQYNCGPCDVEISHTAINYISSNVIGNKPLISKATNAEKTENRPSHPHNKSENYWNIQAPMNEKLSELSNNSMVQMFNSEHTSSDNKSTNEIIIDSNTKNQEFMKEFQRTQNISVMKHISENPDNISETLIVSQDLFSSDDTEINSSSSLSCKLDSCINEHLGKERTPTSSNLLAIDGEIISQPWDTHYNSQKSAVTDKKNTEFIFESKCGNFQNLREKLALAKEDCINTWNKFIQVLEETKDDVPSLESQREENPLFKSYEHHYKAAENICKEYRIKFRSEKEMVEDDDKYVSIEDTMRKWSKFQDIIKTIKEGRKIKRIFHM